MAGARSSDVDGGVRPCLVQGPDDFNGGSGVDGSGGADHDSVGADRADGLDPAWDGEVRAEVGDAQARPSQHGREREGSDLVGGAGRESGDDVAAAAGMPAASNEAARRRITRS